MERPSSPSPEPAERPSREPSSAPANPFVAWLESMRPDEIEQLEAAAEIGRQFGGDVDAELRAKQGG